jgi:NADH dehydrogenase FAD-containing subunit
LNELLNFLKVVDSQMTALPATAQTASQMGKYLARSMNHIARDPDPATLMPFTFMNFGQLAYLGSRKAVADIEIIPYAKMSGTHAWLLWRGVYFSKQLSNRTRFSIAADWWKQLLFGRDISRY